MTVSLPEANLNDNLSSWGSYRISGNDQVKLISIKYKVLLIEDHFTLFRILDTVCVYICASYIYVLVTENTTWIIYSFAVLDC